MRREFWQSHETTNYRCRVSIEWSAPSDKEPTPERAAEAEIIAEEIMTALAHKPLEVVNAMLGRPPRV
jgi:hypothetical protein